MRYSLRVNIHIIIAPRRKAKNFSSLYFDTENSSIIISEAEIYIKLPIYFFTLPAEIERNVASNITLIPESKMPSKQPKGVISEKQTINFSIVSLSIFDLFKCIP